MADKKLAERRTQTGYMNFIFSGLLVLIFGLSISTQAQWPQEESDLKPDPEVVWGTLDNGLRYVLRPHAEPADRVALRLLVDVGSLMEEDDERGLAHFLEHLAFRGTEHYPAGEMVEYFETLGMAHGPDTNAHTSYKETVYKLQLPENNEDMLETGLEIFRDYADGMLLKEDDIENERGVILSELRQRDNVNYRLHKARMNFLFPGHRLSQRHAIGKKGVIKNASRERFRKFYEKWYTPGRMAVIAVGDFDVEEMEHLIKKHFESLKASEEKTETPELEPLSRDDRLRADFHTDREASQTTVSIETVTSLDDKRDCRENRRRRLYRNVANEIINQRLDELSKEEDAPFDDGVAYSFEWLDFIQWGGIRLECDSEQWQASVKSAEQSLRRALQYGFLPGEVKVAKAKMLSQYRQAVKEASTRKSGQIADNILRALVENDVFTTPAYDLEFVEDAFEDLTAADLQEVLQGIWEDTNRNIFVGGDAEPDDADEILAVYNASTDEAVEPPEEKEIEEFAYLDFGKRGKIADQRTIDDLDIELMELTNNVKLNLKETDFEDNEIDIAIRFGSGKLILPEDKPGLDLLADTVFVAGGLGEHSKDDIDRIFAGKDLEISFSVDDDAFLLSGSTTLEDFPHQLRLMTAYLTDPGYRQEALRQARKKFRKTYRRQEHTLEGVLESKVKKFLANGDPRFGFPPEEELMARTLKEVKSWLDEPLARAPMSVSIVGDFDRDEVLDSIRETLGALPERRADKPEHRERRQVEFPETGDDMKIFNYDSDIDKAMALVFYPAPDMYDIQRTRRLQILARIISNRMREELREKRAQVYSPQAWAELSSVYEDYGYVNTMVITSPADGVTMPESIEKICSEIAASGIRERELERAKNPVVSSLRETVRSNRYWLRNVLLSCREYPQRLEWARTMQEDFKAISLEEINQLADQYLKQGESVKVLIMPGNAE